MGRKKTLPPRSPDLPPKAKPPYRQVASVSTVEYVTEGSKGGLLIVCRRGGREIAIDVPKSQLHTLSARLRWPLGKVEKQKRATRRCCP